MLSGQSAHGQMAAAGHPAARHPWPPVHPVHPTIMQDDADRGSSQGLLAGALERYAQRGPDVDGGARGSGRVCLTVASALGIDSRHRRSFMLATWPVRLLADAGGRINFWSTDRLVILDWIPTAFALFVRAGGGTVTAIARLVVVSMRAGGLCDEENAASGVRIAREISARTISAEVGLFEK